MGGAVPTADDPGGKSPVSGVWGSVQDDGTYVGI